MNFFRRTPNVKKHNKLAITKKKNKLLKNLRLSTYYNFKLYKESTVPVRFSISLKKLIKFFVLFKQLLSSVTSDLSYKKLSKLHKFEFKKSKTDFNIQNYVFTLERFACTILYKSRLIPKIKFLKQLIYHNKLYINNLIVKGYSQKFKPLDFIYIHLFLKTSDYSDKSIIQKFDKNIKKLLIFSYTRYSLYLKYLKILYIKKLKRRYIINNKLTLLKNLHCLYLFFLLHTSYVYRFLLKFLVYVKLGIRTNV